jgi:hypothetical protein
MLATSANAQIRIGVVGGANFASLKEIRTEESLVDLDNATAYHAGVFLDIGLGPVGIRPAVYYLNAGRLFKGASFLSKDDFDLVYITIPVDLVYTLGIGPLKPYLFAGPEFRLLNATDAPEELDENIQSFVMNGSLGLGVEIGIPGVGLTLLPHLRYSFGLSRFIEKTYMVEGVTIQTEGNTRLNGWLLSLGVAF